MQLLFNHSFYKYLLRVYYVPGTVLGAGGIAFNKADKYPCLKRAYLLA